MNLGVSRLVSVDLDQAVTLAEVLNGKLDATTTRRGITRTIK